MLLHALADEPRRTPEKKIRKGQPRGQEDEKSCPGQDWQPSAFDWRATAPSNLELDIWQESTFSDESPKTNSMRVQKPIDRAVNSFLQQWLGASPR
jgi:hypothetical protein